MWQQTSNSLTPAFCYPVWCPFGGPAHNNLGLIYLAQGQLYEAAGEFEWTT